ncbi:hypothetical protein GB937_000431 [Aspergillus fischeri]|nr:hypothetical protein GB937_000431 [Aspergillus fischeri]
MQTRDFILKIQQTRACLIALALLLLLLPPGHPLLRSGGTLGLVGAGGGGGGGGSLCAGGGLGGAGFAHVTGNVFLGSRAIRGRSSGRGAGSRAEVRGHVSAGSPGELDLFLRCLGGRSRCSSRCGGRGRDRGRGRGRGSAGSLLGSLALSPAGGTTSTRREVKARSCPLSGPLGLSSTSGRFCEARLSSRTASLGFLLTLLLPQDASALLFLGDTLFLFAFGPLFLLLSATLFRLTLGLLATAALLNFLDTLLLLSLKLPLGGLAALLKLFVALLRHLLAEAGEDGNKAAETVLEGNRLLVLLLSFLESLGLDGLVKLHVTLLLGFVVLGNVLQLLATEGTLQVIDTLGSGANALIELVLLLLELGKLDGAQPVGIHVLQVDLADVDALDTALELLKLLLELLLADAVLFILQTLLFAFPLLVKQSLLLSLLQLLSTNTLAGLLLSLLALQSIGGSFLLLFDEDTAGKGLLVLLGGTSLGAGLSGLLGLDTGLVIRRIDVHACDVKGLGETGELGVLKTLHRADVALSRTGGAAGMQSLGGREDIGVEGQNTRGMVDADSEVALLASVHDELLNHGRGDLEGIGELCKLVDKLEFDGLVNLGQLLEETGEDDLLQGQDVLLHLGIGTDLLEDGGDLLADGERVEVNLEDVVEIPNFRTSTLEQALVQSIPEKHRTTGWLSHTEQVGQTGILVLAGLIDIDQGASRAGGADDGDRQSRQKDKGSSLGHVSLGHRGVLLLGALACGESHSGLAEKVVVAVPSGGMEKIVLADEEDPCKLFVVIGHHDVLGGALAKAEKSVNVFNAAESLLPQLQLHSNIQLLEAGVKMALQGVGIAEVDSVHLSGVLGGVLDVVTEQLAKTAELGLAGVLEAKLEGLQGGGLVHDLKASIVLQDLQDGTVGLPEKLEPRSDDSAVGSVARLFARNSSKQDGLGGLDRFQILDVGRWGSGLQRGLDLVGLGLGLGHLLLGEFDELLEDDLFAAHISAPIDTQFNEKEHDRFERGDRTAARPLRGDMFVEDIEGGGSLAHGDKFLSPLQ